jgi:hypothetical protein
MYRKVVNKARQPVFRILDIFIRMWIIGSVHRMTDPDPDPALFTNGFQDANKVNFLLLSYCSYINISLLG